ncbi:MAG: hypothetical protein R3A47_05000 [Polyangiales bacterium]
MLMIGPLDSEPPPLFTLMKVALFFRLNLKERERESRGLLESETQQEE